jgi:MFS family permease
LAQNNPAPYEPNKDVAYAAAQAALSQIQKASEEALERTTPWLVDVGDWIFAGLIAFDLVVMAPLIVTVSADQALTISIIMFALALPLNLAGLVMLRLIKDMAHVGFSEEWVRAYQDAGLPLGEQLASPQAREAQRKRRATIVLYYAFAVLALSVLLTLTGLTAALWHTAWWIGVVFLAMAAVGLGIVIAALATLGPRDTPEDRARQRRYWDEVVKQVQAQAQAQAAQAQAEALAQAQAEAQAQSRADDQKN